MDFQKADMLLNQYYSGENNIGKLSVECLEWAMKVRREHNEMSMRLNLYRQKIDSLKNTIRKFDEI